MRWHRIALQVPLLALQEHHHVTCVLWVHIQTAQDRTNAHNGMPDGIVIFCRHIGGDGGGDDDGGDGDGDMPCSSCQ